MMFINTIYNQKTLKSICLLIMEEWLLATDKVCHELDLPRVPDHTTLQHTYKKLRMEDFERMKTVLLDKIEFEKEAIAADSSGFTPGQASLSYQTRRCQLYEAWLKGVFAIGVVSQFILAWRSG